MTNASYVVASLSDPLGLGWNLLGTADLAWQPVLTAGLAPAQTLALAGGMNLVRARGQKLPLS